MSGNLDSIVFSYDQNDFGSKLGRLRKAIIEAGLFSYDDKRLIALREIIGQVASRKDAAVSELTEKFDGVKLFGDEFKISADELEKAHREIDPALMGMLRKSIENVRRYQSEIFVGDKQTLAHPGLKYTAMKRVGVCVPGASAPLPSTVIMTAVPAQVAGVEEIAVMSPPRYEGSIHPVILAVCRELGISEVYRFGGAQGVGALAFGTESVAKVDKIVGPGNQWVQMAKKEVFGMVDIDSVAGPSEVLILANESANPAWVAADMLSQAEHAPGSAAVFTDSQNFAGEVLAELEKQLAKLSRSAETLGYVKDFSGIVVFENLSDIIDHANDFASEHLQIQWGSDSRKIAGQIRNAGAIFIGDHTPVAVGDYWAGPSHTLPTGTSAKFFSALSSNDFIKSTSIIEFSRDQLLADANSIIRLAETEGLDAHANSVRIRTEKS